MLVLLLVIRLMGKRQIGEMQPYEFVVTMLIAEVACVPMSDVSIPLLYGITSVIAIFILHQTLCIIEQIGQNFKRFVNGKPSIIIDENGINFQELRKNNLDIEDVIEALRNANSFSFTEVKYAILETSGKVTVIKNNEKSSTEIPILIINNGKTLNSNLKISPIPIDKIKEFLLSLNINSIKQVRIFTIDKEGKYYLQTKNSKRRFGKIDLTNN